MFDLILDGVVDIVVYDTPVLLGFANDGGKGKIQVIDKVFKKHDYGIAVPDEREDLREEIYYALLQMKINGTYDQIYAKWFVVD